MGGEVGKGWQERNGRKEGGKGKGDSDGAEGRWERVSRKGKVGKVWR
jgi:hypothetical protein